MKKRTSFLRMFKSSKQIAEAGETTDAVLQEQAKTIIDQNAK